MSSNQQDGSTNRVERRESESEKAKPTNTEPPTDHHKQLARELIDALRPTLITELNQQLNHHILPTLEQGMMERFGQFVREKVVQEEAESANNKDAQKKFPWWLMDDKPPVHQDTPKDSGQKGHDGKVKRPRGRPRKSSTSSKQHSSSNAASSSSPSMPPPLRPYLPRPIRIKIEDE